MINTQKVEALAGLSLKTFLIAMIGILLFGVYVGVLMDGENSLHVLHGIKEKEKMLLEQKRMLKIENQQLQKAYFQLKQLEPKE
jgi:hypothetical protein